MRCLTLLSISACLITIGALASRAEEQEVPTNTGCNGQVIARLVIADGHVLVVNTSGTYGRGYANAALFSASERDIAVMVVEV